MENKAKSKGAESPPGQNGGKGAAEVVADTVPMEVDPTRYTSGAEARSTESLQLQVAGEHGENGVLSHGLMQAKPAANDGDVTMENAASDDDKQDEEQDTNDASDASVEAQPLTPRDAAKKLPVQQAREVKTDDAAGATRSPDSRVGGLSPPMKQNLSRIIFGTTKPSSESKGNAKSATKPSSQTQAGDDGDDGSGVQSTTSSKRSKPSRGKANDESKLVKKLLVAKKEIEVARRLLRGKRDLTDILSHDDCMFLAHHFWIFTVEQLRFVLRSEKMMENITDADDDKRDRVTRAYGFRKDIIQKLAAGPDPDEEADEDGKRISTRDTGNVAAASSSSDTQDTAIGNDPKAEDKKLGTQELTEEQIAKAQLQIREWEDAIAKAEAQPWKELDDRFAFAGPLSCLIPTALSNFFKSIPLNHLYEFFCLKRTETGAICDYFSLWRRECGLPHLNTLPLSKYLLGISHRIEEAISAVPPVDLETRRWLDDPFVALTGASRHFLVNVHKVYSAAEFVEIRTKTMADALGQWREEKGMPPLRGSGKVAMVSSWKALAREAIEAEAHDGLVLNGYDFESQAAIAPPVHVEKAPPKKKAAPVKETKESKEQKKRQVLVPKKKASDYAANSDLFLDDVLGASVKAILLKAGIDTANKLFDADTKPSSELAQIMLSAKRIESKDECGVVVREWTRSLREQLDKLDGAPDAVKTAHVQVEESEKEVVAPRKKKRRRSREEVTGKRRSVRHNMNMKDPWEGLSVVCRSFLEGIGITTGAEFLTTRTTDIASEFIKYRKEKGMPELKGLGAIASVSAWKTQCRKYAAEMGLDDVAVLEPAGVAQKEPPVSKVKSKISTGRDRESKDDFVHEDVLTGKTRRNFAVQANGDAPIQYKFELSARSEGDVLSAPSLYLTYKGRAICEEKSTTKQQGIKFRNSSYSVLSNMQVSRDKSKSKSFDLRALFSVDDKQAGPLALSAYDVRPLHTQSLEFLKGILRSFILEGQFDRSVLSPPDASSSPINIMLRRIQIELGSFELIFFSDCSIERGQTAKLCFPSLSSVLYQRLVLDNQVDGVVLGESLMFLSRQDLRVILSYLSFELLPDIAVAAMKSTSGNDSLLMTLRAKLRLFWACQRICICYNLPQASVLDEARERLAFRWSDIPTEGGDRPDDLHAFLAAELRSLVALSLYQDPDCGQDVKKYWCRGQHVVYEELMTAITGKLILGGDVSSEALTVTVCDAFANVFKVLHVQDLLVASASGQDVNSSQFGSADSNASSVPLPTEEFHRSALRIALALVAAFGLLIGSDEFSVETTAIEVKKIAAPELEIDFSRPTTRRGENVISVGDATGTPVLPTSSPLFFGIVWPVLRSLGWELSLCSQPDQLKFISPGANHRDGVSRTVRDIKARERQQLETAVTELGLGSVKKLSKRIISYSVIANEDYIRNATSVETLSTAADSVDVDRILAAFKVKLVSDEADAASVVDALSECCTDLDVVATNRSASTPKAPETGVYAVCKLVVVTSDLLNASQLGTSQRDVAAKVLRDLLMFLSQQYSHFFPPSLCPPTEYYTNEFSTGTDGFTKAIVDFTTNAVLADPVPSKEQFNVPAETDLTFVVDATERVIIPKDEKTDLTDFIVNIMEQVLPCHAIEDDVSKKYRRIELGFPGLCCRHCKGTNGDGRYFFSSIDSLMTANAALEKHLTRCQSVPQKIKDDIAESKKRHSLQRKQLKSGAQAAFFARLWGRLRAVYSSAGGGTATASLEDEEPCEFDDHTAILDTLRTNDRWRSNAQVREALNQYYNCLEYGGRIVNTQDMPEKFSSEWLLHKAVLNVRLDGSSASIGTNTKS